MNTIIRDDDRGRRPKILSRPGFRPSIVFALSVCGLGILLGLSGSCRTQAPVLNAPRAQKWTPMTPQEADEHPPKDFPLRGKHRELSCEACHGDKEPTPSCRSCHTPPHGATLKKVCEDCHTAGLPFSNVKFKHSARGVWAPHTETACVQCHTEKIFKGTPRDCTACHSDFHKGAAGRDCAACHRDPAWRVSRFNHTQTGFPLTGTHRAIECGDCHRDLQSFRIVPRPSSCASCHDGDYRSSPFPHASYGASRDCQTCHLQDTWAYAHSPAWFNIKTGNMAGVACATCHTTSGNYAAYSCHACHKGHDSDHSGQCLDCHAGGFPGGGGGSKIVIKK